MKSSERILVPVDAQRTLALIVLLTAFAMLSGCDRINAWMNPPPKIGPE